MMHYIAAISGRAIATGPSWTDKSEAIAAGITALIAIGALVGAIYQLRQTRRTTIETRAHEFVKRYGEPELLPYVEKAHQFIRRHGKASTCSEMRLRTSAWHQLTFRDRLDICVVLNFWEEMGGMYNRKLVDRTIIDEYFGLAAIDLWKRSSWLACHLRWRTPGSRAYSEWEKMSELIATRIADRR